ncbi:unnamed protein product [Mycena citricolor]|uniref:Uncharacterized protein n=1 Tax=Mycena citricolor TaxID=2018698 RepID=A0AAD2Q408_9AGAR|nr:unnamed protein product [Mycena citricolor]
MDPALHHGISTVDAEGESSTEIEDRLLSMSAGESSRLRRRPAVALRDTGPAPRSRASGSGSSRGGTGMGTGSGSSSSMRKEWYELSCGGAAAAVEAPQYPWSAHRGATDLDGREGADKDDYNDDDDDERDARPPVEMIPGQPAHKRRRLCAVPRTDRARTTNGCGGTVHARVAQGPPVRPLPRPFGMDRAGREQHEREQTEREQRLGFWVGTVSGRHTTVVPLDGVYFSENQRRALEMFARDEEDGPDGVDKFGCGQRECGCEMQGVGCAVCGNPLGILRLFCANHNGGTNESGYWFFRGAVSATALPTSNLNAQPTRRSMYDRRRDSWYTNTAQSFSMEDSDDDEESMLLAAPPPISVEEFEEAQLAMRRRASLVERRSSLRSLIADASTAGDTAPDPPESSTREALVPDAPGFVVVTDEMVAGAPAQPPPGDAAGAGAGGGDVAMGAVAENEPAPSAVDSEPMPSALASIAAERARLTGLRERISTLVALRSSLSATANSPASHAAVTSLLQGFRDVIQDQSRTLTSLGRLLDGAEQSSASGAVSDEGRRLLVDARETIARAEAALRHARRIADSGATSVATSMPGMFFDR